MRVPVPLGPFELAEPIARGGMGTVWRAVHVATGVPVAVKVVDERASEELVRALEHEVRTVAGLDHRNVIRVFDQGRVDPTAAKWAQGELFEGSPWFAMELADGGELGWRDAPSWSVVRAALLDLLAALAHAHANGVLHRDLKPANVLFAKTPTGPVLKLSDFGMGWSWSPVGAPTSPRTGGTPLYMAPEQFARNLALQGPWTDLYALGCLAYALVARHPPFPRGSFDQLRSAHLLQPFPAVPARCAAPEGFGAFLRRLVAKAPGDRWSRAADAADALAALPADIPDDPHAGDAEARAITLDVPTEILEVPVRPLPEDPPRAPMRDEGGPGLEPPRAIPVDWRPAERAGVPIPPGIGLALYGLRPIPVVAREAERDLAWQLLRATTDGTPRALLIEGASGCGKSRLAEWLCVRAEETGAAVALRTVHGPQGGERDGLAGMVARHLRVPAGLDRPALSAWLESAASVAPVGDLHPLAELLAPSGRTATAAERNLVLEGFVRRVARDRPVVLWIDDAQWGPDALGFVRELLGGRDARVLVVLTVQEESLADRPLAAVALTTLRAHPRVTSIRLGPLDDAAGRELLVRVLGLERPLAAQLVARTQGNALFAVQLVGDWVQRGLLVPSPDGFALLPGADLALPASIAQLWAQRTAALVGDAGDAWRFPLEVAAVLGPRVARDEWGAACDRAGLVAPDALVDRLESARLARTEPGTPHRFAFVHEMLRETILATAGDRARRWHHAAAAMLAKRGGWPERVGRHLLAAGASRDAVGPLLRGLDARVRAGQLELADELARMVRAVADRELPSGHPAQIELTTAEAQLLRLKGQMEEAKVRVQRAVDLGADAPPAIRIESLRELATLKLHTETGPHAIFALLDEALATAEAHAPHLRCRLLLERGRTEEYYGRLADAERTLQSAWSLAEPGTEEQALSEFALGSVALKLRRYDDAARLVGDALSRFAALELWWHYEYGRLILGEVARLRGDHGLAEQSFRAVIASYERMSAAKQAALPRINLVLVLCATGRYAEADRELARAMHDAGGGGFRNLVRMGEAIATWVAAGLRDWDRFDRMLVASEGLLDEGIVDPDFGLSWREAGDLAAAAGETARARRAWSASLRLWEELGDPRATELRARLA